MKKILEKYSLLILLGVIALHLLLLSKLIFFPYPEIFVHPYLTNNGLLPYKQIFDQHFPGLLFFPINFASLGMQTAQAARLWSLAVVAIIHLEIFFIGRKVFGSAQKAIVANLIFAIWHPFFEGWVFWIDSLLPVFLLPAYFFLVSSAGKKNRLILAGLFLGIASVFKQVVIPLVVLVMIALYLKRRKLSELGFFLMGYLPVPALMVLYFWTAGVFNDFWYWTVVYNLTTFAKYGGQAPTLGQLTRFAFVYGFSIFAIFIKKERAVVHWLLIFVLGGLFAALARFDFVHLQPSLPFIAILGAMGIFSQLKSNSFRMVLGLYFLASVYLLVGFYRGHLGNRILFFDEGTLKIAEKVSSLTVEGERVFVYGAPAHIYQLSKTLPAGNVLVLHFPWFFMVSEDRILEGLKSSEPNVVVADFSVEIQGKRIVDSSPNIVSYILENYLIADKIGNTEILIRKK